MDQALVAATDPRLAPDVAAPFVPALPLDADAGLDVHVFGSPGHLDPARARRRELALTERAIAAKYYALGQRQTWPYVAGTIVGFVGWVAMWPLAIYGLVPLWLGLIYSTIAIIGGWTVAHEAMHETIGRKGTRRFFWNQLTGELALFPLLFPLAIARITHIQHHHHTNDPLRDPDYPDLAPTFWRAIHKVWLNRQPNPTAQIHHVRRVIHEQIGTAEAATAFKAAMLMQLAALTFWFAMAWAGHAMIVALLWWLPRWLALIQIRVGFSWEPHSPHAAQGRYRATRVFRSRFGPGLLSMGIEGHLAHHLYPNVPMHLTPAMLRELAPMLAERGVDTGALRAGWTAP